MGRPPLGGGPAFRFTQNEVVEMESCLHEVNYSIPSREIMCALAEKFSASADRMGRITVQPKQIWNWFQNRRYAQRAKSVKPPAKLNVSPMSRDDLVPFRNVASNSASTGKHSLDSAQVEFEAKSARDGAWYDVAVFLSHRMFETGDPEVRVRFAGFGVEEDEWINVRKCVRQRSLPCEAGECVVVLPGDLILCFQEGSEQALYFDARVLDAQRRRHDVRGCRCRFLVRYEHNQTEEIVPLRKVCRRPESDHRLQMLTSSKTSESADQRPPPKETISSMECTLTAFNTDDSTAAVPVPSSSLTASVAAATATSVENVQQSAPDFPIPSSSSTAAVAAATSMENVQQSAPDIVVEDTAATPLTAEKPSSSDMS